MITWMPDPAASPWYDVQADEVWTEGPITASLTDTDPEKEKETTLLPIGYDCEVIGPETDAMYIQTEASGVTVSAPYTLSSAFPAIDIEYQTHGVSGLVTE
jgi:hypothetical protein